MSQGLLLQDVNERQSQMADIQVPITKAKGQVTIDSEAIPQEVYEEALKLGLKELANRGMSKLTKAAFKGVEADLAAACMEQAEKNVEAIMTGKIRFAGKKAKSGESAAVMTEARRLAKNLVKDSIKAAGMKISHVEAKDITAAANELLAADPSLIDKAKANLAEREKTPVSIDIKSLIKESPKLVAKANAANEKKKAGTLSKTQAGKVAARAKPKAGASATAH
jgi:hypothetical protein